MSIALMTDVERERRAVADLESAINDLVAVAGPLAGRGDGNCGFILQSLIARLSAAGLYAAPGSIAGAKKVVIGQALRTQVFERDEYRCLRCGTHISLRADHVVPESLGGVAELDNLQTLCLPCNSWKGVKTLDFRRAK